MIDGDTRFGAFRKIALPLTLPGIAATLGFVFTAAWSELLFALMLISKSDKSTFPVGLLSFVSKFSVDFGQMMAAGVMALIPAFLFFIFILLSSSLRWGWRETLGTAAALIVIYAVEGLSASTWGTEAFDIERFALRKSYN